MRRCATPLCVAPVKLGSLRGSTNMRIEWTPAVERAMEIAAALAGQQGAAEVRAVHLLAGLLAEEEGKVWSLLAAAGVDPAAVKAALPGLAAQGAPAERILA